MSQSDLWSFELIIKFSYKARVLLFFRADPLLMSDMDQPNNVAEGPREVRPVGPSPK